MEKKFAEEYPNICLLDSQDGIYGVVKEIVKDCIYRYESSHESNIMEASEFVSLLQSLLAYRDDFENASGKTPLLMPYPQYLGKGYNDHDTVMTILPPACSSNQERISYATVDFLVVSPSSEYQQEVIDFIEYYAENIDIEKQFMFYSTMTEPCRPSGYEQEVRDMQEDIEQLQNAQEENAANSEALDAATEKLKDAIANEWLVSQEDIDIWLSVADHIYVPIDTVYPDDDHQQSKSIDSLIRLFTDGNIDAETFSQRLHRVVQMAHDENQ